MPLIKDLGSLHWRFLSCNNPQHTQVSLALFASSPHKAQVPGTNGEALVTAVAESNEALRL